MSCGKCNRATAADYGIEFTSNSCKEKSPAVPRCRFDIDLSDASGVIPASVFGDLAEKLLTFTALEAMDHFNQNQELPLELVHNGLKTKTFLLHLKPVQTQLADARQRYTVLHYSELEQGIDSAHPMEQPAALPISAEHRIETAQLLTPGESNSGSKARLHLTDKFDEAETAGADDFLIATENSNKRTKLG
ncbi:uncharacterized protein [Coffea arabica]|uniref:Replication factor A C-terminal domain-containing protein n=1 Tax=Coffea arabica TaxID=13443 RepID=A0A6P6U2F4_COFAR|nr:uncharacterized protein LOC113706950 isoform X3 [Coffea arabica]XP_027084850.1 uncharacterized protein LOC113706950 isoform X3 [Coffea arabica]